MQLLPELKKTRNYTEEKSLHCLANPFNTVSRLTEEKLDLCACQLLCTVHKTYITHSSDQNRT